MAVGVGIVLASLLLTIRVTKQVHSTISDIEVSVDHIDGCENLQGGNKFNIRVVNIDGPFFFGSTTRLVGQVGEMLGTKILIINCLKVPFVDLSAFFALGEILLKLKSKGILPFIVASDDIKAKLIRLGISSILREDHIYTQFNQAVDHAREHVCSNRP